MIEMNVYITIGESNIRYSAQTGTFLRRPVLSNVYSTLDDSNSCAHVDRAQAYLPPNKRICHNIVYEDLLLKTVQ